MKNDKDKVGRTKNKMYKSLTRIVKKILLPMQHPSLSARYAMSEEDSKLYILIRKEFPQYQHP